ncbi:MAG: ATP-binding protein [Bdellovibrionales bacterium]|jgi:hypothetical protein
MGIHNYASTLANVMAKEFLQNAFDAVRSAYQQRELAEGHGIIDISINPALRLLSVRDNGVGMTPDTVQNVFLRVGTSLKEALSTEQKSGGFGLAKLAFLFAGKEITLCTIRHGHKTFMQTNGSNLLSGNTSLSVQRTQEPNGTIIEVTLPQSLPTPSGALNFVSFPRSVNSLFALKRPLLGKVHVQASLVGNPAEILPLGNHYDYATTPLTAQVQAPWGSIDIYMSPHEVPFSEQQKVVLSAGLYQFNNHGLPNVQHSVLVNVKPSVSADSPHYPFNKQREGWSLAAAADISALNTIILKLVYIKDTAKWSKVFSHLKLVDKDHGNGQDRYTLVEIPTYNKKDRKANNQAILQFSINGKNVLAIQPSQTDEATPLRFETTKPVFLSHYTTDPLIEITRRTGFSKEQVMEGLGAFAYIIHDFLDKVLDMPCFEPIRMKKPLLGIHFNKILRGVNLKVPQDAIFINPARDLGETPGAWAHGWLHTALHESTHWVERFHDAPFTSMMGDLYSVLDDIHPGLYVRTLMSLEKLATDHKPLFMAIREINQDPSIQNLSETETGEQTPSGTKAKPTLPSWPHINPS